MRELERRRPTFEDIRVVWLPFLQNPLLRTQEISFIDRMIVLSTTSALQAKWCCVHDYCSGRLCITISSSVETTSLSC